MLQWQLVMWDPGLLQGIGDKFCCGLNSLLTPSKANVAYAKCSKFAVVCFLALLACSPVCLEDNIWSKDWNVSIYFSSFPVKPWILFFPIFFPHFYYT